MMIMLEYQNIKTFLQKAALQISSEEIFLIKKVENTVPWTSVIEEVMVKK